MAKALSRVLYVYKQWYVIVVDNGLKGSLGVAQPHMQSMA